MTAVIMKKILLIIIFLYSIANVAQKNSVITIQKIKTSELKFDDLKNSSDVFSFRFWNKGQAIDIRILSDSTKTGTITNFITECPFSKTENQRTISRNEDLNVYIQKIILTDFQTQKALETIERNQICNLKSSDSIKNWEAVLDGEWFSTEQKLNGIYAKKDYDNPRMQKIEEARKFVSFYTELKYAINAEEILQTFLRDLKEGCYMMNGEHEIICKAVKRIH